MLIKARLPLYIVYVCVAINAQINTTHSHHDVHYQIALSFPMKSESLQLLGAWKLCPKPAFDPKLKVWNYEYCLHDFIEPKLDIIHIHSHAWKSSCRRDAMRQCGQWDGTSAKDPHISHQLSFSTTFSYCDPWNQRLHRGPIRLRG